jgi:ketosteroid isomerase-like protein
LPQGVRLAIERRLRTLSVEGNQILSLAAVISIRKFAFSTGETAAIDLRVTHVYRRKEDGWKVIHRHGEHLVPKGSMEAIVEK